MSVFNYASGKEVARVDVGDHPQRIREGSVPEALGRGSGVSVPALSRDNRNRALRAASFERQNLKA